MVRLAFIASTLLLLPGCIGISRPEVQVTDVRLDEVSEAGGRILVDLTITNPNDEELPIPRVSYRVNIIGAGEFEFTDRAYAALPREGMTKLTLPAAVRGIALAGRRYEVQGVLIFEPQGELRRVFYDNYVPLPSSRFSGQGVLK